MTTYAERREAKGMTEEGWQLWIGRQVVKTSRKPFKSGEKVNTVKGIVVNPQTGHNAFEFVEDGSNVECWRCKLSE